MVANNYNLINFLTKFNFMIAESGKQRAESGER
nr:hypothetical protein [Mucilaginibacter sp. X4EP1]